MLGVLGKQDLVQLQRQAIQIILASVAHKKGLVLEIDPDGLLVEGDGGASIGELGDGHQVVAKFRDVVHVGKPSFFIPLEGLT